MKSIISSIIFILYSTIVFGQVPKRPTMVFQKNTSSQSWKTNYDFSKDLGSMIVNLQEQIDASTSLIKSYEDRRDSPIEMRISDYKKFQEYDFYNINERSAVVKLMLRNLTFRNFRSISRIKPNFGFAIGIAKNGKLVQVYFPYKSENTSKYSRSITSWIKLDIPTSRGEGNIRFLIKNSFFKLDKEKKTEKIIEITGLEEYYFENVNSLKENKKYLENLISKHTQLINNQYKYLGSFDNNGNRSFGILLNSNKDTIFIGEWKNDLPDLEHGKTFLYSKPTTEIIIEKNGVVFKAFSEGYMVYVGPTTSSGANGHGKAIYHSGDFYQGEFVNGQKSGTGTYYYNNGYKYYGEWENGVMQGMGVFTYPSGSKNEGLFENGKFVKSLATIEQERIAEQNRIAEQERIEEQNRIAEENRKLEQQRMVAEIWQRALRESQSNTNTNNNTRSTQQTQQTQYSTCRDCGGSGKCSSCNRYFKMTYIGNRCSLQQKEFSNPGHVRCEDCRGFGFTTTTFATKCDCPGGIGSCIDKECYVSICDEGWIPCRTCYGKGVCNSCKGTGRR
jgi:hypothetical protein